MRKLLLSTAFVACTAAAPAFATDYVGVPTLPGAGETGCMHFQVRLPSGQLSPIIGARVDGTPEQQFWAAMIDRRALAGVTTRVHAGLAGGAISDCREDASTLTLTGVGIP